MYTTASERDFIIVGLPTITLNNPIDAYNTTSTSILFNCTGSDAINLSSIKLYVDGVLNQTNSTPFNNTPTSFTVNGLVVGEYNWTCNATNNNTLYATSTRDFNISLSSGTIITLNNPINAYNTSDTSILFNCTGSDAINLSSIKLYVDGVLNQTNSTPFNNTPTSFTVSGLVEGLHNWTCNATNNNSMYTIASERNFTIDTTIPFVNITNPLNGSTVYNATVDLNWTAIDSALDTCWYNFGETTQCYQESANTTDQSGTDGSCSLDYSGNYNTAGTWIPNHVSVLYDGSWATTTHRSGIGSSFVWINYTKPINAVSANLRVSHPIGNVSLPVSCFNMNPVQISMESSNDGGLTWSNYSCWNGSWYGLSYLATSTIAEDAIWWDISNITIVNCADNYTTFQYPATNPNSLDVFFYANDTFGNVNSSNITIFRNTIPPQVNITAPVDGFIVTNASQNISFTYFIGTTASSCWFSIDDFVTNLTTECNSFNYTIYPGASPQANLTLCSNDTFGNINCTSVTLLALTDTPFVNLTLPVNNSIIVSNPYQLNWTLNNSMAYNGCYVEYNVTGSLTNKSVNCTDYGTTLVFPSEDYQLISLYANGSFGYIAKTDQINVTKYSNITFVNITSPVGIVTGIFDPGLTLNVTANYYNITILNNCWYAYNGSNQSIACFNNTITAFSPVFGVEYIQVCANDTFGNIGCANSTWGYQAILLWNSTNKESFTEGELMNFSALLYSDTGFTPYLIFNGTSNVVPTVSNIVNYYNLTYTAFAPQVDLDPELIPYYWQITFLSSNYTGVVRNISVYNITMGNCTDNLLMNITGMFDESTRERIYLPEENVSVGVDVRILTYDGSITIIDYHWENTSFFSHAICTDLNFSLDYRVEVDIDYNGNDTYLSKRIWYMEEGILPLNGRNLTELTPQNISLYLLNPNAVAETPSDFVFRYYDTTNELVSNAIIHIYRKNIGSS